MHLMTTITEADVEQAAIEWLSALGWQVAHGPDIAPDMLGPERAGYGQVVLEGRLRITDIGLAVARNHFYEPER